MELNIAQYPQFTRLAGVIFEDGLKSVEMNARNSGIFQVESIPQNSGNTRDYQEIDLEQYSDNKDESNQAARARVQIGYNKVLTAQRSSKDIGISVEMRKYNKYQEVTRKLTNLGKFPMRRQELDLSHLLGFGTATTYVDKNGATRDISTGASQTLWGTAHTLRGTSTTYRNRLAGNPALSKGALEGIERLATEETLNNFGEKVDAPFDILWTTDDPVTVNTALEYLNSVAAPDFANSGVTNVYKAKYKHVRLPLVPTTAAGLVDNTKRRYWGLASSELSTAHLAIFEEPYMKTPDEGTGKDFATEDWNYGVAASWAIGVVVARGLLFSSGDATA